MTLDIAEEVLTPQEAAIRKGVPVQTIYKAIERKKLLSTTVLGRVTLRLADVDAYEPGKYGGAERAAPSFETILWQAADKLRGSMDAAEYKHVVLGLIFLKFISDSFEELHEYLLQEAANPDSDLYAADEADRADIAEDRDEYRAENIFWVPKAARWSYLVANARDPKIGVLIDDAMTAVERDNPGLKGVLPKEYARPALDKRRLGELIDQISNIGHDAGAAQRKDILGRAYEYFLGRFASAEGKRGGEFYTPRPIVQLLVEMIAPYHGKVYDPCCGSGGMFVQSEKFVQAHGGRVKDLSIYGQEMNANTWKLAKMNLAIRGIDNNLGPYHDDTFHNDLHPDLKADFILSNPPFNISDWGGQHLANNVRWKLFGTPPSGNANYAWIEHMIHHLAPHGMAGFVLANGSMSSNTGGEGEIRRRILEADLVDCIVSLPGQLFYTTQIPVCLWFLTRQKNDGTRRDRRGETLFIDARQIGHMESRVLRTLSDDDIAQVADTYHAWRGDADAPQSYADVAGFCKSAKLSEIAGHGYVLTPGRYVGAAEVDETGAEPFEEKMARLSAELRWQFAESRVLEATIEENLRRFEGNTGTASDD